MRSYRAVPDWVPELYCDRMHLVVKHRECIAKILSIKIPATSSESSRHFPPHHHRPLSAVITIAPECATTHHVHTLIRRRCAIGKLVRCSVHREFRDATRSATDKPHLIVPAVIVAQQSVDTAESMIVTGALVSYIYRQGRHTLFTWLSLGRVMCDPLRSICKPVRVQRRGGMELRPRIVIKNLCSPNIADISYDTVKRRNHGNTRNLWLSPFYCYLTSISATVLLKIYG